MAPIIEQAVSIDPAMAESMPKTVQREWILMMQNEKQPATIRVELTGMLPAVIKKVEELLVKVAALAPSVINGYQAAAGRDSFYSGGAACRIQCADMASLKTEAVKLGFIWLTDDGDIAYTGGLTIDDFKTCRVNGDLNLTEKEGV